MNKKERKKERLGFSMEEREGEREIMVYQQLLVSPNAIFAKDKKVKMCPM
jgi:hypothetical protein